MESSSSAHQREEERHPLLHSPCHLFEQLITSCLKCLGLDHLFTSSAADDDKTKEDHQQLYPPPQTETEMKHGEEVGAGTARSTRALRVKRPWSLGSGSGPQIN
ncbi:uncharacterized protein LOC126797500 [Argentina anserina]|uniref:uncharacterized protein LOC126797500 n=1 Tax=Argentina anserina TaxID=57926 RepID=UPI0021768734|nr:uncharacterized protein LOC126797500 [Potentilla anserina]